MALRTATRGVPGARGPAFAFFRSSVRARGRRGARVALLVFAGALTAAGASEPSISDLLPVGRPDQHGADRTVDGRGAAVPDDATLEANGAVISEIRIRVGDIFDPELPEENNLLFRTANRVHYKTRQGVIRRLLLFEPGDRYSRRLLDESERILRATKYLYDARIFPVRYEDNRVAIQVVVRDVWTLHLGVGFSRTGGENSSRIGLQDSNFLGSGKEVTVRRRSDVDRTSYKYRFLDPNLRGSRTRLRLGYADNSDGSQRDLLIHRPFYSLDARWAAGLSVLDDDRITPLYDLGEIFDEFRQRTVAYRGFYGMSRGRREGSTRRLSFGFAYQRERFDALPGQLRTDPLPADRIFAYPFVRFQWLTDRFIETHDLDRLRRTEDLNLGREVRAELGWTVDALDSTPDRAIFDLAYLLGTGLGRGQILLVEVHGSGRYHAGRAENVIAGGTVRYYLRDLGNHVFFAAFKLDVADALDGERQLLLGGDSGLRGYPLRYASGDRRYLLTLEQRFYTDWHVLRLAHIGAAVFLDVGEAWFSGERGTDEGVLKDVGFGPRIGSSRSSSAAMVHLDVAFPLDGNGSIEDVQLLVRTRETF